DTREMAFRLRQTVKLLLSKEIPISYPRLLDDLLRWQRYPRRVRQEWARSYYAAFEKEQQNNTTSQDDQSNNAINQNN
ncbi:MAG TPA: type I-E CRISPR-associated protein Cse2/CasB, partial [Armatimonadota bacterium]|nr:type I-E CRISPR-associated protein Cse2/CasB [Armatimonadota bacterium]